MALPKDDLGLAQSRWRNASHDHVGVPDHALLQRNSHSIGCVAAQVLIRKKEDLFIAFQRPLECSCGIGRGAYQPSALTAEGLDGRGGIHVGEWGDSLAF